jgi:hypothetical protein
MEKIMELVAANYRVNIKVLTHELKLVRYLTQKK